MDYCADLAPSMAKQSAVEELKAYANLFQGNLMLETFSEFCCLGSSMSSKGLDQKKTYLENKHAFQETAMNLT